MVGGVGNLIFYSYDENYYVQIVPGKRLKILRSENQQAMALKKLKSLI
jgi:hypothetical protein